MNSAAALETQRLPLVSIVTPCLNSARFLEETILSVLGQDYPRIEYIVMDGGSQDGTLEILRRYEASLRWNSAPDRGQADAVNRGFLQSSGEIFAFLNADDLLLPGAVSAAVRGLAENLGAAGVYGEAWHVDESGGTLGRYETEDFDVARFQTTCFICQPAAFLRREAFQGVGMLDPALEYALDYDLWIRVARTGKLVRTGEFLAASRMHRATKTLRNRREVYREAALVVKRHFGYVPFAYAYGWACARLDSRDGFLEPVPASVAKYSLALVWGTLTNPRHPFRFWKEWWAAGQDALRRDAWPPPVRRRPKP
jgi:glycosyltransferase involved in cell wall biosynthesis